MQLENEFLVDAPLERTWLTLLDIQRVAQCLPGAQLESDGADGIYRGSMQVKVGPMSLRYKGTARMAEVEEDDHIATIEVQAKEAKGQGTASARIRNRLEPQSSGSTRVFVSTELSITGRPAQFGRGIMEDVAGNMLEDFAKRLESEVLAAGGAAAATGDPSEGAAIPGTAESAPQASEPAMDLVSVVAGPLAKRAAVGAGILVAVIVLLRFVTGSRRHRRD